MDGHFFARRDGILDFVSHAFAESQLREGEGGVLLGNGVNLLALTRSDGNGFDRTDGLRAVGEAGVLDLAGFIRVAVGGAVDPECFGGSVFQGAGLLGPRICL